MPSARSRHWSPPPDVPTLSIVIVTYNSRRDIARCLDLLRVQAPRSLTEIIVVDNASPDETAPFVRQRWPDVRVLDAGGNIGFAGANNIGIRASSGEFVLVLNPDTEATGTAIDMLVACLERTPAIGAVGPQIVDSEGRRELSWGAMISPWAEAWQKLLVTSHDRRLPVISQIVQRRTGHSRDVDWVSGACLLARRRDLEAVGLFDERFFLYTEDVDLCASLRRRGQRVHFLADARIVHHRGQSAASAPAATRTAYRRSHLAFYDKHHPGWVPLLKAYLALRGARPDRRK